MNHQIQFSSSFICATFKFCENVGNIWSYLHNRPTSTKYVRIVCLRLLIFDIVNCKPLETMLNYVGQFFKSVFYL